jgi:hypothetical protein
LDCHYALQQIFAQGVCLLFGITKLPGPGQFSRGILPGSR